MVLVEPGHHQEAASYHLTDVPRGNVLNIWFLPGVNESLSYVFPADKLPVHSPEGRTKTINVTRNTRYGLFLRLQSQEFKAWDLNSAFRS